MSVYAMRADGSTVIHCVDDVCPIHLHQLKIEASDQEDESFQHY